MPTTTLFILLVLLSLAIADNSVDYVTRQISPELAVNCTTLRLPTILCSSCPLKPHNENGNFAQILDAFQLGGAPCQSALQRYVALNPCDTVRAEQIANQTNPDNERGLEIFMYAMCETCCDCIPIGALVDEYDERKSNRTLLTPLRGNCVIHYLYDTCKLFPDLVGVARPMGNSSDADVPVCDLISEWRRNGGGQNWVHDPAVEGLPRAARRHIARMIRFQGCRRRSIWEGCVPVEQAAGRL